MANKKNLAAINKALATLEKRYGEKVVSKMTDVDMSVDTFSSGRGDLDIALGGGYGVGKIIEIFAESGTGKSGLALEAAAAIQKEGGLVAFIDAEHVLNTEYAEAIGVNVDEMYISQPSYGEQAFEAIRALINSAQFDLIIIDSVAALTPKAELECETGEAKIALQARMMAQGLRQITAVASDVGCTIMFINQLRDTIGGYGPNKITPGGKALKFYATQRLEIKNRGQIKEGENVIGFRQIIKVVKNKIAQPFKVIENPIVYGIGVDKLPGLVEQLVFEEILIKKGSWFNYMGTNIAQGLKQLREMLEDNPELLEQLEIKLKEKLTKNKN